MFFKFSRSVLGLVEQDPVAWDKVGTIECIHI